METHILQNEIDTALQTFQKHIPEIISLFIDNPFLQWRARFFAETGKYGIFLFECLHEIDSTQVFCHCIAERHVIRKYPVTASAEVWLGCSKKITRIIMLHCLEEFRKRHMLHDFHNKKGRASYIKNAL